MLIIPKFQLYSTKIKQFLKLWLITKSYVWSYVTFIKLEMTENIEFLLSFFWLQISWSEFIVFYST